MDNPSQKVRFINVYKPFNFIDADVKDWLDKKITELDESWSIILFSHALFEGQDDGVPRYSAESERLLDHIASLPHNAQIVCWLAGHCHFDAIDNSHGITVISTQTDNLIKSVQFGGAEMMLHTDTEQSFDCYQIDLEKKEIYITKIGAGSNRQTTWGKK